MFHVLVITFEIAMKPCLINNVSDKSSNVPQIQRNFSFKGDVLRLVTGTGAAQIISILGSPIITRLYSPVEYGVAALFAAMAGTLGALTCLAYEQSIILPDNDREAANLLGVSLITTVLITIITFLIISLSGGYLLRLVNAPKLMPYLWLMPITILIRGISVAFNSWNTRSKHFARLSFAQVTTQLTTTSTTLAGGFAGYANGSFMILSAIVGQTLATIILVWQSWLDVGKFMISNLTWREMWTGAKRYRKFPLIESWSGLLNTASVQLPSMMFGIFFSPITVGLYALGYRVVSTPMALLGGAIGQVFFQRASAAKSDSSLEMVVISAFEHLLLIAVYPFLLLLLIGPELFTFVFGAKWSMAGVFVQILAPWLFVVFLGSPLSSLTSVLELQEVGLMLNIGLLVTRLASFITGGLIGDLILTMILYSMSGALIWGWFCFYLMHKSGVNISKLWAVIASRFFTAVIFLLPIIACKWVLSFRMIIVLAVAVASASCYYVFIYIRDPQFRNNVQGLISQIKKVL